MVQPITSFGIRKSRKPVKPVIPLRQQLIQVGADLLKDLTAKEQGEILDKAEKLWATNGNDLLLAIKQGIVAQIYT